MLNLCSHSPKRAWREAGALVAVPAELLSTALLFYTFVATRSQHIELQTFQSEILPSTHAACTEIDPYIKALVLRVAPQTRRCPYQSRRPSRLCRPPKMKLLQSPSIAVLVWSDTSSQLRNQPGKRVQNLRRHRSPSGPRHHRTSMYWPTIQTLQ